MTFHDVIIVIGVYLLISILGGILQRIWPILGPAPDPNAQRLARLESKVNLVLQHLGMEQDTPLDKVHNPVSSEVQHLIVVGRKIEAIKLYREQTGVGLAEAKDAVLSMEAQMRVTGLV